MDPFEEQKASNGGLATIVFLITAIVLFFAGPGLGALFSLRGISFILIGMFVAALIVGIPMYLLERGVGKLIISLAKDVYSEAVFRRTRMAGAFLFVVHVLATVGLTYGAFNFVLER